MLAYVKLRWISIDRLHVHRRRKSSSPLLQTTNYCEYDVIRRRTDGGDVRCVCDESPGYMHAIEESDWTYDKRSADLSV